MKKASELSVLCDVDIGLFIFSSRGRPAALVLFLTRPGFEPRYPLSHSVSTSWILFQKMLGFWLYATFLAFTELKRIEDKNRRQFSSSKRHSGLMKKASELSHVSSSKRRSGRMKKASELSVLCDVNIGLFIFPGRNRLH
ncbi:hypothetical protein RHSIM_Rhsim12G0068800 [Rhododendron simsii]|uniref:MADS-box domain-containing protein n=1 Tax=Rhododendron simsii TaxID=118357 RepID=A0A834L8V6_RHOSS|nr:hypothetical protein RHSIM_Rhsim12G0068800 [Rhododendron simsii]